MVATSQVAAFAKSAVIAVSVSCLLNSHPSNRVRIRLDLNLKSLLQQQQLFKLKCVKIMLFISEKSQIGYENKQY